MTELGVSQIGPVRLGIGGDGAISTLIRNELGSRPHADPGDVDLAMGLGTTEHSGGEGQRRLAGSRFLLRHEVELDGASIRLRLRAKWGTDLYAVSLSQHPYTTMPVSVQVETPFSSPVANLLTRPLVRWGTRDFTTMHALIAKNVLYEIVDPLLWCAMLARDATFVHAGAVADPEGRGILLLGLGGVGKSTTVLDLVCNEGWSYLSDDLAIVDSTSTIVRYPKYLQVYAYNTDAVPGLEHRMLAGRSVADRAHWRLRRRLLGAKQARRRVPAARIAGSSHVTDSAPLSAAFFLVLAPDADAPSAHPKPASHVAALAARALLEEFWDFLRLLSAASALDATIDPLSTLYDKAVGLLEERLPPDACFELQVPPYARGSAISEAVRSATR